ncbi:MAG: hypothetical protein KAR54_01950 [Candidatus Pacebacteria bacterium]|nr:hypothetical protein [Candidatus Paceibacterota bacterium]
MFITLLVFNVGFSVVEAATFFLSPKTVDAKIGDFIDLEVRINSENQGFNAAQAIIQFPKDILEVKSVDTSPTDTIFNFWIDGPRFSNEEGKITFLGGTTNGVVGSSIQILKIVFVVKGIGEANIVVSDAAVTASDGSGTNILSTIEVARFDIKPTTIKIEPKIPTIIREPSIVKNLPKKPEISISLYPDPKEWYNSIDDFLVKWSLPLDISGISTVLNENPSFVPESKSEGIFDTKIFPVLKDGVQYLHIKFKNNIGWGPVNHYRLAIDTMPPLAFNIDVLKGLKTDNPTPTILFETNDSLSGLKHYLVMINNEDIITLENGEYILPVQDPGELNISIRAVDMAGNIRENNIILEILPIKSPVITFVSENLFVGEGGLMAEGIALPNTKLLLYIKDKKEAVIFSMVSESDKDGNWELVYDEPLKKNQYFIEVVSQDDRGAKSLFVKSELFKVKERPLLVIANIEITQFWFFVSLILIMSIVFSAGWFSYQLWRKQVGRKAVIAQRDVVNILNTIKNITNKMLKNYSDRNISRNEAGEMKFLLNKIKTKIEKTQKYIIENIKEIGK